ncbi:uncharacterized protein LOC143774565 [Ranitomeya variabilis]|uniref:uncharacterized protein LOC143774565 n=1 Tax=Ranitomeya variabilis TaxID=490064 RepID=UPI00405742E4
MLGMLQNFTPAFDPSARHFLQDSSLTRDEFPLLILISKMNFLLMNHVTRKNVTLLQTDNTEDSELWEPHTVIVVVIFGLVCVLHLTAFLYTVCLQSYVNVGAQAFSHPFHYRRQDKEKNVFYGLISPIFMDNEDSQKKERTPIMVDI